MDQDKVIALIKDYEILESRLARSLEQDQKIYVEGDRKRLSFVSFYLRVALGTTNAVVYKGTMYAADDHGNLVVRKETTTLMG